MGGILVTYLSSKIKSPAKVYIGIASLFMISSVIVYIGTTQYNYYIIGLGVVICGLCDCSSMSVGLILAGKW